MGGGGEREKKLACARDGAQQPTILPFHPLPHPKSPRLWTKLTLAEEVIKSCCAHPPSAWALWCWELEGPARLARDAAHTDPEVLVSFPPPSLTGRETQPTWSCDQGLPKKGQSQSGGRTPPLWQAAGAEPGRLESLRSQREGYRRRRQQSEQTQGGSGCLASCPGGERVGRGGGGAAELGCGRSYWHHVASDFYFRGTDMHSAEWTFVTFAGPSSNLPLPSAP